MTVIPSSYDDNDFDYDYEKPQRKRFEFIDEELINDRPGHW
jgi:hypothetical protein